MTTAMQKKKSTAYTTYDKWLCIKINLQNSNVTSVINNVQ